MSLKDRLKSKKEVKTKPEETVKVEKECGLQEYKISIEKLAHAASAIKNPADLGNIVREFAKFLNTLSSDKTYVSLKGDFDLGQKTLLNCVLNNFVADEDKPEKKEKKSEAPVATEKPKEESPLVRRRRALRAKLQDSSDS